MGILEKLKSVLGWDQGASPEPEATVEREPTGAESARPEPSESEQEPTGAAAQPVQKIKGIGPAYADQLGEAGVETVGDLAAVEPQELADATGLSAARIENWVEQARART